MARRAIILIEGHRSIGSLYLNAAERLGLCPITLSADPTQYDYLAVEGIEAVRVDTSKLHALIRECCRLRETYEIAGITGFSGLDESVPATISKLCRHFDLPGPNPASIERCRDKFTQHQILARAGVPMPAYHLAANATDVKRSAAEIGLPVIVKPAVGSGSRGVRLCHNADELTEHTHYLLGEDYIWLSSPRILVEKFAQGPHYSVELMGNEIFGIAAVDFGNNSHFVGLEYTFPAALTADEHRRITDVSLSCLQALDIGWGPTNIDLRWTDNGPVVIEVNPRLAGGTSPQLVQAACGVDLIKEHIKLVIGCEWDLRKRHSQIAAARILIPDCDGTLDWIDGDDEAAAVPSVTEVKLHVVPKTPIVRKGDFRDSVGYIIAASPDLAQTRSILERAVDLIDWSITPFV
ncbi:acetyl-CoA carboxylase biotin carboxylase subunit family protein [Mesorhizobium sp. L103C105A0]|uniref:ATP-grasp domain-containing protein n=1 Tax=Mesorhizobium sp. L103C105A0 TaxID=1287074 RepID=UPI0004CE1F2F|nr:acetyl-CoA carboxylase biotin carboxylase subunit family protein [Mesorhizobium sp. L103C105A0]